MKNTMLLLFGIISELIYFLEPERCKRSARIETCFFHALLLDCLTKEKSTTKSKGFKFVLAERK